MLNRDRLISAAFLTVLIALFAFAVGCEEDNGNCDTCPQGDDDQSPDADDDASADPADCAACHAEQATAWNNFSSHNTIFTCDFCHEEVAAEPGSGHRTSPGCYNCHSEQTHNPTYNDPDNFRLISCATCHDPHGSENNYLIRQQILIAPAKTVNVTFTNTSGRAAGSYASPVGSEGAGLCEVCHLNTRYYNAMGTGESHNTGKCTACHSHAVGFEVLN
jgi:hypothetical protein